MSCRYCTRCDVGKWTAILALRLLSIVRCRSYDKFYSSILAILDAWFQSARFGIVFSRHLTLVTFTVLAVYLYRDIWPLMTFTLQPADSAEGILLWVKIALLAFVGVVEPLFEPFPYAGCDLTVSGVSLGNPKL